MTRLRKNKITVAVVIAIIIILVIAIFRIFNIYDLILKEIYPLKYMDYIEKYAEEFEQDKYLILAIIKAESNFEEKAISNKEAKGLMQLMEATAEETARKLGIEYEKGKTLFNPAQNIRIGIKYFSDLYKNYNDINLALAAYNAGTGNVRKWIDNGTIKENGEDIENIPIKETNTYVRKILRDYEIYKKLYN